jgi:hypothetical protein
MKRFLFNLAVFMVLGVVTVMGQATSATPPTGNVNGGFYDMSTGHTLPIVYFDVLPVVTQVPAPYPCNLNRSRPNGIAFTNCITGPETHYACLDPRRVLLTAGDGSRHCLLLTFLGPQGPADTPITLGPVSGTINNGTTTIAPAGEFAIPAKIDPKYVNECGSGKEDPAWLITHCGEPVGVTGTEQYHCVQTHP